MLESKIERNEIWQKDTKGHFNIKCGLPKDYRKLKRMKIRISLKLIKSRDILEVLIFEKEHSRHGERIYFVKGTNTNLDVKDNLIFTKKTISKAHQIQTLTWVLIHSSRDIVVSEFKIHESKGNCFNNNNTWSKLRK